MADFLLMFMGAGGAIAEKLYNPNQPRGKDGKWSGGAEHEGDVFVSPNVEQGLTFEQATAALHGERHERIKAEVRAIAPNARIEDALGVWSDGQEDSMLVSDRVRSEDDLVYEAARMGLAAGQTAVIPFNATVGGRDAVWTINVHGSDLATVRTALERNGLPYQTLVPRGDAIAAMVFDKGAVQEPNIRAAAGALKSSDVTVLRGHGDFLGGSNHEEGIARFKQVIERYEARHRKAAADHTGRDGGGGADGAAVARADGGEAAEDLIKAFNENQPRDDHGRWDASDAEWVAQTKVRNEDTGLPMRVWHGTNASFDEFSDEHKSPEGGFFFTDDPRLASSWAANKRPRSEDAGPNVRPVYLDLRNPLEVDMQGKPKYEGFGSLIQKAKRAGHDGVIIRNTDDGPGFYQPMGQDISDVYVAFSKDQIKSGFSKVKKRAFNTGRDGGCGADGAAVARADGDARAEVGKGSPDQPRDDKGRWAAGAELPPEPGTSPIPDGNVRLYHQTSDAAAHKIETEGIKFSAARGIEGPKAVWASETGFYGKPGDKPTIEFSVPKSEWTGEGYLFRDIKPSEIIAVHYPWHQHARYILNSPETFDEAHQGKLDDLLRWENEGPAVRYIKSLPANYLKKSETRKRTFSYTPHVTLKYIAPDDPLPVQRVPPTPVTFGSITLSVGAARTEFPLTGVRKVYNPNEPRDDKGKWATTDKPAPSSGDHKIWIKPNGSVSSSTERMHWEQASRMGYGNLTSEQDSDGEERLVNDPAVVDGLIRAGSVEKWTDGPDNGFGPEILKTRDLYYEAKQFKGGRSEQLILSHLRGAGMTDAVDIDLHGPAWKKSSGADKGAVHFSGTAAKARGWLRDRITGVRKYSAHWVTVNGQHVLIGADGKPAAGNPLATGERRMSERVRRAVGSAVLTGKREQDVADRAEEKLSRALGIPRTHNNSAFDLMDENVGIEVKTLVSNKASKITMGKTALGRKVAEAHAEGIKAYTVVVDMRNRATARYYFSDRLGSLRLGSMRPVTLGQLRETVNP